MTINGATTPIVTQVRRSKRRRNSRRYGSMVWGLPIAGTKSRPARTGCLKAWALSAPMINTASATWSWPYSSPIRDPC